MTFKLDPLPWANDALAPHISANTISFHYGKHHNAYVEKLNAAVQGTALAEATLEDIIKSTAKDASKAGIFNNAAQTWNHTFFWNSLKPGGGGTPTGALADAIKVKFGGFDKFKEEFSTKAATLFGSGWVWLAKTGGGLEICQTFNAGNPLTEGKTPLLTLDVWEHAYYLDHQNRRPDFIKAFLDSMANWSFAAKNFGG
jgi:Fe-Mn family superoxide dismutase